MELTIRHATTYDWDGPVPLALQQVRLRPRSSAIQLVEDWRLDAEGGTVEATYRDENGNDVALISVPPGATSLRLEARGRVRTLREDGVFGRHRGPAPLWLYQRETTATAPGDGLRALAAEAEAEGEGVDRLHALARLIAARVEYGGGSTDVGTSAEAALAGARGVCQDHAQIFVACARLLGHPARYVSGYLAMDDRVAQDATHAWADAHVEGLGWVGFDPSNGISPDGRYARMASGPDYAACAPVRGLRLGTATEALDVSVSVAVAGQQQQQQQQR